MHRSARADVSGAVTAAAPAHRRTLAHLTVRARLLTAVVLLAALTVMIAGGTAFALQAAETDARIDNSLSRAVAALRQVQAGKDPTTNLPFDSVSAVLKEGVRNRVPGEHEGIITLVDGEPNWRPADETRAIRLERDDELVAALATLPADTAALARTVTTGTTEYRLVTVPVHLAGDPGTGMFVVAFDRAAEMSGLRRIFLTYSAVGLAALAVTSLVAWFVVGRMLRPVRLLRDTTRRVTESDLSERIAVTGKDDLSDLARTVNSMLDRLERAFGSQRELARRRRPRAAHAADDRARPPRAARPGRPDDVRADAGARPRRARPDAAPRRRPRDARHRRPAGLRPLRAGRRRPAHRRRAARRPAAWATGASVVAARADVTVALDAQRVTQALAAAARRTPCRFSAPGSTVRLGSEVSDGRLLRLGARRGPGRAAARRRPDLRAVPPRPGRPRLARRGSGLPIVAAIADAHGGRSSWSIHRLTSGPASVFVLDLPAVDLVDGESDRPPSSWSRTDDPHPHRRGRGAHRRLRRQGPARLRVRDERRHVRRGRARAGSQAGDVDLLVLDLGLVDIDGFEVLRRLRAAGETVPVIVLTARSSVHGHRDGPGVRGRRLHGQAVPVRGAARPRPAAPARPAAGARARPRAHARARSSSTCGPDA